MAPAHPHATTVAVYPALFFPQGIDHQSTALLQRNGRILLFLFLLFVDSHVEVRPAARRRLVQYRRGFDERLDPDDRRSDGPRAGSEAARQDAFRMRRTSYDLARAQRLRR